MSSLVAREETTSGSSAVSTLTHTFESAVEEGEFIYIIVRVGSSSATTLASFPPSGYTIRGNANVGISSIVMKQCWKVALGGEVDFTATLTAGTGPMTITAWRFTPSDGYSFGTPVFDGAGDLSLGDMEETFFPDLVDVDGTVYVVLVEGTANGTGDTTSFAEGPGTYVPPAEYIDVFPGDGANVVLGYWVTAGAVNTDREQVHWAGMAVDVTDYTGGTMQFDLDVEATGIDTSFTIVQVPLVADPPVAATEGFRYEVTSRRVDARELPYQVTAGMFTNELGG